MHLTVSAPSTSFAAAQFPIIPAIANSPRLGWLEFETLPQTGLISIPRRQLGCDVASIIRYSFIDLATREYKILRERIRRVHRLILTWDARLDRRQAA